MNYIIRDREAGNVIEECATIEEARETICRYEADDRKNGIYEANFYEIYNSETEEIEE